MSRALPGAPWKPRQASWIASRSGTAQRPNEYEAYRLETHLDTLPGVVTLRITAATRYRLFVNGVHVGDGPPASGAGYLFVDECEIGKHLARGRNVVAVLVHRVGIQREEPGGLLAEAQNRAGDIVLATGSHWRAERCRAWKSDTFEFRMNWLDPFQEWFDSRLLDDGWRTLPFDETPRWTGAEVAVPPPVAAFYLRPIPPLVLRPTAPVRVVRIDECLSLENRIRPDDLSIALSMPGRPIKHATARGIGELCRDLPAGPAMLACGTDKFPSQPVGKIYDPCVVFDFGRILNGCLRMEVDAPAGAVADVGFAERLIDGWFNNSLEGQFAARWVFREGQQVMHTFTWRAQRYVKLRLRDCLTPFRIHRLEIVEERAPLEEKGEFRSSDPMLNRVFHICRRTLALCVHDQIMDTPWREQGQWLGDVAGVTAGGLRHVFGDVSFIRKWLVQAALGLNEHGLLDNITSGLPPTGLVTRPIASYSLWWVLALREHWLYTGDDALASELFDVAATILRTFRAHTEADGLVGEMPGWAFVDWAAVDLRGCSAVLNALYAAALRAHCQLAEHLGRADEVESALLSLWRVTAAFGARFWDERRGCFVDASAGRKRSEAVSEHTNAAALWGGLATADETAQVIRNVFEERTVRATETQPFFTRVVIEALDQNGRWDLAEKILRERWVERFVRRGFQTTPEEWSDSGTWRTGEFKGVLRSLSHAWSAYPAEGLLTRISGLRILEPGCTRIVLAPRPVPWDYRLALPLPQGVVTLSCRRGRCRAVVPPGIEVETSPGLVWSRRRKIPSVGLSPAKVS